MSKFAVLKQSPDVAGLDVANRLSVAIKRIAALQDLVHLLGAGTVAICDKLEDEGGRTYLGTTNHADMLRRMKELYDEYRFEADDMGDEDALCRLSR